MFADRVDAGKQLSSLLLDYKNKKNTLVLGLPRGGVVVAYEIAKNLHLPLDVICPTKLGAPYNPELAIGAVTETGQTYFNDSIISQLGVHKHFLDQEIESKTQKAKLRFKMYRQGRAPYDLKDKTVILVDDGLATGATMKAAIQSVSVSGAKSIVVAVPVAPPDTLEEIRNQVNEVFCIDAPWLFQAVGQFYKDFSQTEDNEVLSLLSQKTI